MQGCTAAHVVAWVQHAIGNDQPLLDILKSGSQELLSVSRDFWSGYGKLPIVCFFEDQESSYGPVKVTVSLSIPHRSKSVMLNMALDSDFPISYAYRQAENIP